MRLELNPMAAEVNANDVLSFAILSGDLGRGVDLHAQVATLFFVVSAFGCCLVC
jgi:hypothetical protein